MKASKENSRVLHWKNGSSSSRLTQSQALGPWTFISEKMDTFSQESQLKQQQNNWTTIDTPDLDTQNHSSLQTIAIKALGNPPAFQKDKRSNNDDLTKECLLPPRSSRGPKKQPSARKSSRNKLTSRNRVHADSPAKESKLFQHTGSSFTKITKKVSPHRNLGKPNLKKALNSFNKIPSKNVLEKVR